MNDELEKQEMVAEPNNTSEPKIAPASEDSNEPETASAPEESSELKITEAPEDSSKLEITEAPEDSSEPEIDIEPDIIDENKGTQDGFLFHFKNIIGILKKYITSSVIDAIIIGGATFVFMIILGMPHKILIAVVVGITNLIPNFGPVIGAAFGGVLLIFSGLKNAIFFLIFAVVLQIVDGFIIKPKLFGESLGVSGVVMMIAMLVGGAVFGIVGMLFMVPVIAIINYIIKKIVIPHIKNKDKGEN